MRTLIATTLAASASLVIALGVTHVAAGDSTSSDPAVSEACPDGEEPFLYTEMWQAKQSWLDLPIEDRVDFMNNVGQSIGRLTELGVHNVGFAIIDPETPHGTGDRYTAVWTMPCKAVMAEFERTVEADGFYDYFEQINARGLLVPPPVAIEDMINL
jgi:hypothetical protein